MRIANFHDRNPNNIGDMKSAPMQYFEQGHHVDFFDILNDSDWKDRDFNYYDVTVIGGGSILGYEYEEKIVRIVNRSKNPVVWGCGVKSHEALFMGVLERCAHVGIRFENVKYNRVPCASCMSTMFDHIGEPTELMGYVLHQRHGHLIAYCKKFNLPYIVNKERNLYDITHFIEKYRTIVSTSYHGLYWAKLLGRNTVMVVNENPKFYGVNAVEIGDISAAKDLTFSSTLPDPMLESYRDETKEFARKIGVWN